MKELIYKTGLEIREELITSSPLRSPEETAKKLEEKLAKFAEEISGYYIPIQKSLPSVKNGYIDEMVLVFMKNKNKEDGILLWDLSSFDGGSWSKRSNTWEDIIGWRPVFIK